MLLARLQLTTTETMCWISLFGAISTEIEAAYAVGQLPPIPSSAALVSKSENTNCNSLTVWPLRWLAWRAEKAGALPTVWHHSVEFHGLYASHFHFVTEHGCVVSIPYLSRNMQSYFSATDGRVDSIYDLHMHSVMTWLRRVVSTPGLHWMTAYLELSLYIIIEPTRSQVRAAQKYLDIADDYPNGCAGGEGSPFGHWTGGIQANSLPACLCALVEKQLAWRYAWYRQEGL